VIAGCGGGEDRPSREQFTDQVNAICRDNRAAAQRATTRELVPRLKDAPGSRPRRSSQITCGAQAFPTFED